MPAKPEHNGIAPHDIMRFLKERKLPHKHTIKGRFEPGNKTLAHHEIEVPLEHRAIVEGQYRPLEKDDEGAMYEAEIHGIEFAKDENGAQHNCNGYLKMRTRVKYIS